MSELLELGLSNRVARILESNNITSRESLLAHNERELLGLPRFGSACLSEVERVLGDAGLSLTVDPFAKYVCARHGEATWDTNLSNLFLCDECAEQWQVGPFAGQTPEFLGEPVGGFCVNCNVQKADVKLRQWFLCGTCERVAKSIGRSVVAERFFVAQWNELVAPHARNLRLRSTDEPKLRRREKDASKTKVSEIDFVADDTDHDDVLFGLELKTGKSYISGVAQVGARMGQFQLDTSDCDDITTVMEREDIPVYLLHVQVIDRAHAPTVEYRALRGWWTDVFRMHEQFQHLQRRPRETRDAAYFNTAMFEDLSTFANHIVNGDHERLAERLRNEGIPTLYER